MVVGHESEVPFKTFSGPEVKAAAIKAVVGGEQGWKDYVMRIVELGADGHSPRHTHDWPHINYVLEGEGVLFVEGKETPISPGSYAFVPPGALHQYRNRGKGPLRFICIVPREGHSG